MQNSKPQKQANFIKKLCSVLKNKQFKDIIYWDQQLKGIRINNQKKMQSIVLPKYYRHKKISSFVRQLNMYDFHKVHLPKNKSAFCHAVFDLNNKSSYQLIQRKNIQNFNQESDQIASNNKINMIDKIQQEIQLTPINEEDQFKQIKIKPLKKKMQRPSLCLSMMSQKSNCENEVLDDILEQIKEIKITKQEVSKKLRQLRNRRRYNKLLYNPLFVKKIYSKLEMQYEDEDKLQNLSIQDELFFTKRSIDLGSLKMLQSGPYFVRDTLKNLFI